LAANKRAEVGKGLSADLVVDPHATLAAIQEPQFVEHLQVVADGGLSQVEGLGQIAYAGFAAGVGGDQGQEAQAHRLSQGLQQRCDLFCLGDTEGLTQERRATGHGLDGRQLDQRVRHPSMLTHIYVGGNV
jgi:hypothetical protein